MLQRIQLWIFYLFYLIKIKDSVMGISNVHLTMPNAIQSGKNATLLCQYELDDDDLYSVKWYKGRREFFRYTPKEIPSIKLFPYNNIHVDVNLSNSSQIVLYNVTSSIAGKFTCEVSADYPSFHTIIIPGELNVVELPIDKPKIELFKASYSDGEYLTGNCTSEKSLPATKLLWRINNYPIYSSNIINYPIVKDSITNLERSKLGINLLLSHDHFINGRLKIQCIGKIYDLYEMDDIVYVSENYPQIILNNENDAHFSFMSDRDTANKSSCTSVILIQRFKSLFIIIPFYILTTYLT